MRIYFHKRLLCCFAIGFLVVVNNICFADDKYNIQKSEIKWVENLDQVDNSVEEGINQQISSPVSKKRYFYYYYPASYVYYSKDRQMYYYLENDDWKICAFLPSNFKKNLGKRIRLDTDTNKPYLYHNQHIKKFEQEDSIEKKKSFLAKLIYMMLYKH
jgi:hypothetical protein